MMRRIVLAIALALGAVALTPGAPAQAINVCPTNVWCLYVWYADANKTQWMGTEYYYCYGGVEASGTRGPYHVVTGGTCPGDPGPTPPPPPVE